ncbi:MAG: alpha/beta hydrolase [Steroidobacteraceae bacterium]
MTDKPIAPSLVLLPGLDGTGKMFTRFVAVLGPCIQTQTVVYPVDQCLGYRELETRVRAVLPSGGRFVVLGESFSGPIAIRLAADPPAGLVGLVLCVTFAKNPYPLLAWAQPWAAALPVKSLPRWVRAPFMWGASSPDGAPDEADRATAAVDEAVLRHRIAAVMAADETPALTLIRVPTLVMRASHDHVIPRASSEYIRQHLPQAELIEIDGPHLLLQSRPSQCAAAISQFVRGLPR